MKNNQSKTTKIIMWNINNLPIFWYFITYPIIIFNLITPMRNLRLEVGANNWFLGLGLEILILMVVPIVVLFYALTCLIYITRFFKNKP